MNEIAIDRHLDENARHQEELEQESQVERLKLLEHDYGLMCRLIDDLDGIANKKTFDHLIEVKDGLARQIGYLCTGCHGARIGTTLSDKTNAETTRPRGEVSRRLLGE